jgi:hypothetical protein
VSLLSFFAGLILTASAVHATADVLAGLVVFVTGVLLTFGLLSMFGYIDYRVRMMWYESRNPSASARQSSDRHNVEQPAKNTALFRHLFVRLLTIAVAGAIAAWCYHALGSTIALVVIGGCVLVLVIFNKGRRI